MNSHTFLIAKKEFRNPWITFSGGGYLLFLLGLGGLFFLNLLDQYMAAVTQKGPLPSLEDLLQPFWTSIRLILTLLIPLITGRGPEIKTLRAAPLTQNSYLLGSYLGSLAFIALLLLSTSVYPLYLLVYGNPDPFVIFSSYIGLLLLAGSYLAIGFLISHWIPSRAASVLLTTLVLFSLGFVGSLSGLVSPGLIRYISPETHLKPFFEGTLSVSHSFYFFLLMSFSLFFARTLKPKHIPQSFLFLLILLGGVFLTSRPSYDLRWEVGSHPFFLSKKTLSVIEAWSTSQKNLSIKGFFRDKGAQNQFSDLLSVYERAGLKTQTIYLDPDRYLVEAQKAGIKEGNEVILSDSHRSIHLNQWEEGALTRGLQNLVQDSKKSIGMLTKELKEPYPGLVQTLEEAGYECLFFPFEKKPDLLMIPSQTMDFLEEEKKFLHEYIKSKGSIFLMVQAFQPVEELNALLKDFDMGWNDDFLILEETHPVAQKSGQNNALLGKVSGDDPITKVLQSQPRVFSDSRSFRGGQILAYTKDSIRVNRVFRLEDLGQVEPHQIERGEFPIFGWIKKEDMSIAILGSSSLDQPLALSTIYSLLGDEIEALPIKTQSTLSLPDHRSVYSLYTLCLLYPFFYPLLAWVYLLRRRQRT
jgi:ABC-2 type transport system permease protein